MYWILGLLVYGVLLAATLLFFAGCSTVNRRADENADELLARARERRAA